MLLLKNPQFLSNCYETWSKCPSNGYIQMAKYQLDWVEIVDFSLIASYFSGWMFFWIWSQCVASYLVNYIAINFFTKYFSSAVHSDLCGKSALKRDHAKNKNFREINFLVTSLVKPLI